MSGNVGVKREVADRIRWLEKKHGYLTPDMLVEDAREAGSPLHSEFDWDLDSAAHAYWLYQARGLIRSVKVLVTTETLTISTVAYVRDPTKCAEQGYLSVARIRNDKDLARAALVDEFKRISAALQRAQRLAIAFGIEDEIDAMSRNLQRVRRNVEEVVAA